MSLPVQGSDALTVAKIVYYLYDSWKNVPREFQSLCREATILQAELRRIEEHRRTQQWSNETIRRYEVLSEHTRNFLGEFRKTFVKYKSLRENKKTPRRLIFRITNRASELRGQMSLQLTALQSFQNELISSQNELIEQRTDSISANVEEIKQLLERLSSNDTAGEIYSELRKNNVSEDFVRNNKDLIYSSIVQVVRFHEQSSLQQPIHVDVDPIAEGTEARHPSLADEQNAADTKDDEVLDPEELDRLIDEATATGTDFLDSTASDAEQFWPPFTEIIEFDTAMSRAASVTGSETSEEARIRKASFVGMLSRALQDVGNSSQAHDGVAGPPSPDLRKARTMSYAESLTPTLVDTEKNDLMRKDTSKSTSASSTQTQSTRSSTSPSVSKKKSKGFFGSLARVGTSSIAH